MNFAIKMQMKENKHDEVPLQVRIPTMYYDGRVVADMADRITEFRVLRQIYC